MFTTVVPRGGRLVTHRSGARCYEPSPLPPSPDLSLSPAQWRRVTDAERALGRLEGKLQGTRWATALVQLTALQEAVAAARLDGGHLELRKLLWWQLDGERAEVGGHTGALRLAAQHATLVDMYYKWVARHLGAFGELQKMLFLRIPFFAHYFRFSSRVSLEFSGEPLKSVKSEMTTPPPP